MSHLMLYVFALFVYSTIYVTKASDPFRANVTFRMELSNDMEQECDESVYKVVVCAGEFTDQCKILGPVTRYVQAVCAGQGPMEQLSFKVTSVESPIALDVSVQQIGDPGVYQLRGTEFRLVGGREVNVASYDLSIVVRFHFEYKCLRNYFGQTCDKFCDTDAAEHVCDDSGNPICRTGFYLDVKSNQCRRDQCTTNPHYCKNGGSCVPSPDHNSPSPFCLCPADYFGSRCELTYDQTTEITTIETSVSQTPADRARKLITEKNQTNVRRISTDSSVSHRPTQESASHTTRTLTHLSNSTLPESKDEPVIHETVFSNNGESEPAFKRIIVPLLIGVLIVSLFLACVGFLIWAIVHMGGKKECCSSRRYAQGVMSSSGKVPRRWASVDDSPTKMYNVDGRYLNNAISCLPSLNTASIGMCPEKLNSLYGMHACSHLFDPALINHHVFPCYDGCNQFATLSRPASTLNRRRTTDLATFFASGSQYSDPKVLFPQSFIPPNYPQLSESIFVSNPQPDMPGFQQHSAPLSMFPGMADSLMPDGDNQETVSLAPPPSQFADASTYMHTAF